MSDNLPTTSREPVFNVPTVLLALIASLFLIHAGRAWLLTQDGDLDFLLWFAFIPVRYDSALLQSVTPAGAIPDGIGPQMWTFVSYALLHADWMHLFVNTVWLLPFGAAVARRFGTVRFILMFAATSIAGALAHLFTHLGELVFMIGASGAVSGFMAAAVRFAFQRGGPLENWRHADDAIYLIPAAPLSVALRNPRVVIFVLVWFAVNILFGIGVVGVPGGPQDIAWQAHVGGFIAGLILFPLFDPVGASQHKAAAEDHNDDSDPSIR